MIWLYTGKTGTHVEIPVRAAVPPGHTSGPSEARGFYSCRGQEGHPYEGTFALARAENKDNRLLVEPGASRERTLIDSVSLWSLSSGKGPTWPRLYGGYSVPKSQVLRRDWLLPCCLTVPAPYAPVPAT